MQIADISLDSLHTPLPKYDVCCLRSQDVLFFRNQVDCGGQLSHSSPPSLTPVSNKGRRSVMSAAFFVYKKQEICAKI